MLRVKGDEAGKESQGQIVESCMCQVKELDFLDMDVV
jgi:hypothetical protein